MHARPNAVASLRCQESHQNCYTARLTVRPEGKLSSLGRAHPIFCSTLSPGGAPQKSGEAHQHFSGGAILSPSTFKLLPAPLDNIYTGYNVTKPTASKYNLIKTIKRKVV